ncbi:HET-C-related protein [Flavobacterium sp. J27]|uniref:HET-C-related protein n=1 Tax=Flavobacterium sp. J27 TaxID=2060419 RepID=UPI001031A8E9|nr:HET-C-related protein [Flavobacterium sp. J27]
MTRTRIVKGTITEKTGGNEIYYASGNIVINAGKKINITSNQGVVFGEPEIPNVKVLENKVYTLESTYALDQLTSLAEDLAEMPFIFFMLEVFGNDIEVSALSKLYKDLCDKKVKNPEIIVSKIPVNGHDAGYSNKQRKIIVYEKIIEEAVTNNDTSAMLLAALVEEFGHHIDNLLRTDYATNGKEDNDVIDEGAKFSYQLFKFDIFNESTLTYATTEIPAYSGDLVVDFSKLHEKITTYVNETQQYDEIPGEDISNFGAGRNRKTNTNAAYAHGDIEFESLVSRDLFDANQVNQIYYGNWLRDFSQVIVGLTVRSTNFAIQTQKNKVVEEASPMKLSHQGWVNLIEILAIKEFVYDASKHGGKEPIDNYNDLKKTFDTHFGALNKDILGIYRPEEHIDNPKGLEDESQIKDDKGEIIAFNYNGQQKTLYAGDNQQSWLIDSTRNMSNFFWRDFPERPATVTYVKEQIRAACNYGKTKEGFRCLGAALHVLEDYFAHTNFTEIALRMHGADVYPWIQDYKGKAWSQLPVVSGTFLADDTIASVGPKISDLLFDPKFKEYKRRVPKHRTLAEMLILKTLQDFANGQKSDTAKTNSTYLGVEFSTWLSWFEDYLNFQDFIAAEYKKADGLHWFSTDFPEKLGARMAETFSMSTNYLAQAMGYFPKVVINVILGSFDKVIPEAQSHLNSNYGNCPSHSQLAKDSYSHPLNKLAASLAKTAVKDIGTKFNQGWNGDQLANYIADTYFVHPEKIHPELNKIILDWKNNKNNQAIIDRLKYATIFEHAHVEIQEINKASMQRIKEVMDYFKKNTK